LLRLALERRDWRVSEIGNWRDSGWQMECQKPGAKLEIVVANLPAENEWMAQISPVYFPGPIGRLFRRQPSAPATPVLDLARDVHAILSDDGKFSHFRWRWGGHPSDEIATSEPTEPDFLCLPPPRTGGQAWRPGVPPVDATALAAVLTEHPVVVLHCWAVWNPIDQKMDQTLQQLQHAYVDRIHFRSFETDLPEHYDLCREWAFWNLPALVCFIRGRRVGTVVGCLPCERLIKQFDRWLGQAIREPDVSRSPPSPKSPRR
jgi:hypothetical protein